ncbi:MAG: TIGR00153 family protein [Desulfobacterales bacterium]
MFLEKIFSKGNKENQVIGHITKQIKLLCTACGFFKTALETDNLNLMRQIMDIERSADNIRRDIISKIYEGAFLPYLRPDLCKFVEIVDSIFDLLKDTGYRYLDLKLPDQLKSECVQVAFLNRRICEMLLITFESMLKGEDLREKILAIRIYEKKIDDIKFDLIRDARKIEITNFWDGEILSQFLSCLTSISDVIEDASDHLQIIHVSMK